MCGRSRDYYSAIGLCHLLCSGLRKRSLAWELHRSLLCRLEKGKSKVDLPWNFDVGIVLSWVFSHVKLRDRWEVISSLIGNRFFRADRRPCKCRTGIQIRDRPLFLRQMVDFILLS
ncbi:hypothetical protein TNCV_222831 [Trichonephila clavipes]|nr:hypothetical protein TNCV_222831 [Trichonephila clavipes]